MIHPDGSLQIIILFFHCDDFPEKLTSIGEVNRETENSHVTEDDEKRDLLWQIWFLDLTEAASSEVLMKELEVKRVASISQVFFFLSRS